ncbi:hypothetical protein PPERSA_01633 [Pseudocohnilembus persalinus]|uniref:Dynein light chain n=1 Tax=Pseudocohnilembus persalinus TaxID=266149 RepID=A0A0V0R4N6_PSEPJ|nr:hypothetical protein PPERSA_01633 [Pseudocohnilembus persalinus]|eukprot:KRX09433.1 hypothetical protein PPERSA_01633 [Pseudocohnilembus persalinus]
MDSGSEEEVQIPENTPPYKVRYQDMDTKLVKDVVRKAEELFEKYPLENNVAVELVQWVKNQPQFKIGEGQWQCIIGENFGCSLTFDAKVLVFFDLESNRKSILLFKSG